LGSGVLLNLSISRGLMSSIFVGQSIENIQNAQTTLQHLLESSIEDGGGIEDVEGGHGDGDVDVFGLAVAAQERRDTPPTRTRPF